MTLKRILFSMAPLALLTTCGEVGARLVQAPQCSAIVPDAGDWDTMQGDPELLWTLEPNRRFQTGNDVTEINAVGLREQLLPTTPKSKMKSAFWSPETPVYTGGECRIIKPTPSIWRRN